MPGNPLVRFDEGRGGRNGRCSPSLLLYGRMALGSLHRKPATVIAWRRKGFRLFWTWKVRRGQRGRPPVSKEVRNLIRKMSRDNPIWGAPRIHGELLQASVLMSARAASANTWSAVGTRLRRHGGPYWKTT